MSKQAIQVQQDGASLQLRCTRGLNRGDVLLTVPDSLWITVKTVANSSIGSVVGQLAPWLQVILTFIICSLGNCTTAPCRRQHALS